MLERGTIKVSLESECRDLVGVLFNEEGLDVRWGRVVEGTVREDEDLVGLYVHTKPRVTG